MVGTYTVTYEAYGSVLGTETLVLRADGRYEQVFVPVHGKGWKHSGSWTLDNSQGTSVLVLSDYWAALDEYGDKLRARPKRYPNFYPGVYERSGRICILIHASTDQYYCKVK